VNCTNCGAAMELVESRRYFICSHCGSFSFPEAIDVDGIRIVGRTADAKTCPICSVPMDQALLDDTHAMHFCGKCRGMLLPRDTFAGAVQRRRAWAQGPVVDPPPLDRRAYDRKISCPLCHAPFMTYAYGGPGAVVMDGCERCDVVWLDYRELKQIVDAPGSDRGSREMVPRSDDYQIVPQSDDDSDRRTDPLDFLFSLLS
jgi:Zn-finger nucleic acid-binding protein